MVSIQPIDRKLTNVQIYPLGNAAATVRFGTEISPFLNQKVKAFVREIEQDPFTGFIECIPAFASVTVFYDLLLVYQTYGKPNQSSFQVVRGFLERLIGELDEAEKIIGQTVEIPVCYGGEFGPDLAFVAEHNQLSQEEVIERHTANRYPVYMIGFAPGFPYLGGLSEKINAPRRSSPRTSIPAGSVGIAGSQTGVYPISTPGGWRLIGRTPIKLFQPDQEQPSLLSAGDVVKFVPITKEAYLRCQETKR